MDSSRYSVDPRLNVGRTHAKFGAALAGRDPRLVDSSSNLVEPGPMFAEVSRNLVEPDPGEVEASVTLAEAGPTLVEVAPSSVAER